MKPTKFALLLAMALSACATTKNYEKMLDTLVGSHVDVLTQKWGPPKRSYPLSGGNKVNEYMSYRTFQTGGYSSASGKADGKKANYSAYSTAVETHERTCITRFTISPKNIILRWTVQGNDCVAPAPK